MKRMTDPAMTQIRDVLKTQYFTDPDDLVDVSAGYGDLIHVVIVSKKLAGKRTRFKDKIVNELLFANLPPEIWGRITLTVWCSPEDVKMLS